MAVKTGLAKFDHKIFNEQAFGKYLDQIPRLRENAFLKSGVLVKNETLSTLLSEQTGSHFATIPILGRINGTIQNYDGKTNITAGSSKTYHQNVIALGRASAFMEKDFSYDITGGVDFLDVVGRQVVDFWEDNLENDLLSVLTGVFAENTGDTKKTEFITGHTLDLTKEAKENLKKVDAVSLNNAIQKASGDKKNIFNLAIMHSQVATNLENLKLLEYYKQTAQDGIERNLTLASWNGREVIITDDGTMDNSGNYITYILGKGAIEFSHLDVKVANEMVRDAKTNGGETTLITRRRYAIAPKGFSYVNKTIVSPMKEELEKGTNWELINDGEQGSVDVYPHKAIAIARIISKG